MTAVTCCVVWITAKPDIDSSVQPTSPSSCPRAQEGLLHPLTRCSCGRESLLTITEPPPPVTETLSLYGMEYSYDLSKNGSDNIYCSRILIVQISLSGDTVSSGVCGAVLTNTFYKEDSVKYVKTHASFVAVKYGHISKHWSTNINFCNVAVGSKLIAAIPA